MTDVTRLSGEVDKAKAIRLAGTGVAFRYCLQSPSLPFTNYIPNGLEFLNIRTETARVSWPFGSSLECSGSTAHCLNCLNCPLFELSTVGSNRQ